ncbi:hypothetical protein [Microbispora sp. H10830]|uniref:hypothetical protein n=1 Tax=Microbispora sp. H10830 TaxID=2729109 RepID=UPI0037CC3008
MQAAAGVGEELGEGLGDGDGLGLGDGDGLGLGDAEGLGEGLGDGEAEGEGLGDGEGEGDGPVPAGITTVLIESAGNVPVKPPAPTCTSASRLMAEVSAAPYR